VIKSIGLLKRKKGLTREQFLQHYEKIHAPLFLSKNVPGLTKYVQNHPAKGAGPEFETDIDGISELWFDDLESLNAFYQWMHSSPEAQDLRDDSDLYVDLEEQLPVTFLAEVHVLKEE
jgi:uncharacterized protein (TIGR02118 family)